MDELKIEYLPPGELTPYENNARIHSVEDIEAIKASIRESGGFNDPIGIWGPKNLIVEGHGRRQAAMELGIEKVPCIRLDHMTDAQRRMYTLSHNRTAELSGWQFDLMDTELNDLRNKGFDTMAVGFAGIDNDLLNQFFIRAEEASETKCSKQHTTICPHCGCQIDVT